MASHAEAHHDDHAHGTPTGWRRYMYSTNHKDIGTLYLIFAIGAGLIGAAMSVAMRMELAGTSIGVTDVCPGVINTAVTLAAGEPMLVAALSPKNQAGATDFTRKLMVFVKAVVITTGR